MKFFKYGRYKIIYKFLTVFISIFWGVFVIFAICVHTQKKYLYPRHYSEYVEKYAQEFKINEFIVYSFIKVESSFNKNAVSPKGAIGLMQILPSTAIYISEKLQVSAFDLSEPETNILFGCYYLRYLADKFEDSTLVICAYNAGETRVREWLGDTRYSEDGITLKEIPYKETRNYVEKIEKTFAKYVNLHRKTVDNLKKFE